MVYYQLRLGSLGLSSRPLHHSKADRTVLYPHSIRDSGGGRPPMDDLESHGREATVSGLAFGSVREAGRLVPCECRCLATFEGNA